MDDPRYRDFRSVLNLARTAHNICDKDEPDVFSLCSVDGGHIANDRARLVVTPTACYLEITVGEENQHYWKFDLDVRGWSYTHNGRGALGAFEYYYGNYVIGAGLYWALHRAGVVIKDAGGCVPTGGHDSLVFCTHRKHPAGIIELFEQIGDRVHAVCPDIMVQGGAIVEGYDPWILSDGWADPLHYLALAQDTKGRTIHLDLNTIRVTQPGANDEITQTTADR